MTQAQIAKSLGISPKTVQRAVQRQRPDLELTNEKLGETQRQIAKQMPITRRVQRLVETADTSTNPFAVINSVRYLNELDDIQPALEREKVKRDKEERTIQPLFMLPVGSQVNITLQSGNQERVIHVEAREDDHNP